MSLTDEKNLVLVAIISGVFILTTLSTQVGSIYFAMTMTYAIAIALKGKQGVIEFAKSSKEYIEKSVMFGFGLIGAYVAIGSVVLGSPAAFAKSAVSFATTFNVNFTISDPVIQLIVYSFFIPLVETLFFYGVIFKFILSKSQASDDLKRKDTIIAIIVMAGIATAFHFAVHLVNEQSLLTDLIFFGATSAVVLKQKELSGAFVGHLIANLYWMLILLHFIPGVALP